MTSEDQYIPVNKGHSDLESDQRRDKFQKIAAAGWEDGYQLYREKWHKNPETKKIEEWPLHVDLELVSRCNLKCPMCPTLLPAFQELRVNSVAKGLMDTELAKKIISEVAGNIFSLRLSWVGESTLHPDLPDILKYAKEKGIPEVSFLTNGARLTEPLFHKLVSNGLDILTISVDGLNETYERIRAPIKFDTIHKKIKRFADIKSKLSSSKPLLKIQSIWPAIADNPREFYDTFKDHTDFIAFNPLIDYLHEDDPDSIVFNENFSCPQLYQRLTVAADGRVAMCSNDDFVSNELGNANETPLYEIWHGTAMNAIRDKHREIDGFKSVKACASCYYPRAMEVSSYADLGSHTVEVERYINRPNNVRVSEYLKTNSKTTLKSKLNDEINVQKVLEALLNSTMPDSKRLIADANRISGITIKNGHINFTIEIDLEDKDMVDVFRGAAESAVLALEGVSSAKAVLTAHETITPLKTSS